MSALSCTDDFFPDLLCCEDSEILSQDLPECSSDLESPADIEESIARFIEDERKYVPRKRTHSQSVDSSARQASVAWILKVYHKYLILYELSFFTCLYYFCEYTTRNFKVRFFIEPSLEPRMERH